MALSKHFSSSSLTKVGVTLSSGTFGAVYLLANRLKEITYVI